MKEILNTMLSALTRGEGVMLCSILKADGSSPRGAGAHMAVFADGTALGTVGGDFRRIFDKVSLTADDYAVVMTPGHQADYEILEQVLRTLATYIGCIGSRKKVALTRERLAAAGFSQQDIDRVHAPIGLPILAETPEEIAISVAAEMIRHRAEHL